MNRRATASNRAKIAELRGLAAHARMSHRHWLLTARQSAGPSYGPAYCLDGAAIWRRRLAELLKALRRAKRLPRNARTYA